MVDEERARELPIVELQATPRRRRRDLVGARGLEAREHVAALGLRELDVGLRLHAVGEGAERHRQPALALPAAKERADVALVELEQLEQPRRQRRRV